MRNAQQTETGDREAGLEAAARTDARDREEKTNGEHCFAPARPSVAAKCREIVILQSQREFALSQPVIYKRVFPAGRFSTPIVFWDGLLFPVVAPRRVQSCRVFMPADNGAGPLALSSATNAAKLAFIRESRQSRDAIDFSSNDFPAERGTNERTINGSEIDRDRRWKNSRLRDVPLPKRIGRLSVRLRAEARRGEASAAARNCSFISGAMHASLSISIRVERAHDRLGNFEARDDVSLGSV